eukprot:CAMPEP_0171528990 /NCGR_PEP_ID=MMETSP0959-20130129/12060_1 /TAXON_ID=87120 /ORGANISM="Aurantiochytrium limacinum, Strain ATCCMYA-1381" /LENGTH=492 /DNA_ID=CAMNT_0012071195 /DNA_START=154 /DNA_END=1632 /DNA_ORIENTATION=-
MAKTLVVILLFLQLVTVALGTSLYDGNAYEYFQNDFYGALGLSFDHKPSAKEISKAYRRLSFDLHPDRNANASPERFQEIVRAKEVLMNEESRADYDDFIERLPRGFRPVYGLERPAFRVSKSDPVVVVSSGFVVLIWLISYIQNAQWSRERAKAMSSIFFKEQREAVMSNGGTEEAFLDMFFEANPEFRRGWNDTVGAALLRKVLSLVRVQPKFLTPTKIPSREEMSEDELEAGRERQHQEEEEQLHQEKLEAERFEKERRKQQENERRNAKRLQAQHQQRMARLKTEFDANVALILLELQGDSKAPTEGSPSLILKLAEQDPSRAELISSGQVEAMRDALAFALESAVANGGMSQEEEPFWRFTFDEAFAIAADERLEAQEQEQEIAMAAERERIRKLQEGDNLYEVISNENPMQESSMTLNDNENGTSNDDVEDTWGRELAELERLKREKKAASKELRKEKAAANKVANEERKQQKGNNKNKNKSKKKN